jgi:hypothetical protein
MRKDDVSQQRNLHIIIVLCNILFRQIQLYAKSSKSKCKLRVEININGLEEYFFLIGIVGGRVQLGPLGNAATNWPIVPAPGDHDDGEIGGMISRGNRSTRRKPAPVPLCPPQTPYAARTRNRSTTAGSQRLLVCSFSISTNYATACPWWTMS